MVPHRYIILGLLLSVSPSATYASPADNSADSEICAEELAAEQSAPNADASENAPKRRKRNVWNPYDRSSGVGDNFSRYSGADEYDSVGTTEVPDEPQAQRSGGSSPAPKAGRSGGSRLRRG